MELEHLDGTFSRIDAVVCRLEKLPFAVLLLEEGFDWICALVVGHVECGLVSFIFEFVEDGLEGGDDHLVFEIVDGPREDVVRIIFVRHEEVLRAVQRPYRQCTGLVGVHCVRLFVC